MPLRLRGLASVCLADPDSVGKHGPAAHQLAFGLSTPSLGLTLGLTSCHPPVGAYFKAGMFRNMSNLRIHMSLRPPASAAGSGARALDAPGRGP